MITNASSAKTLSPTDLFAEEVLDMDILNLIVRLNLYHMYC